MKKLTLLLGLVCLTISMNAQEILKSTNEKISGKAAAGSWIDYTVAPADNLISFSFETKKNKKSAKYETYTFDMDLNYKGMEESELEFEKAKKKFVRQEASDLKALRVGKNMLTGQMVMETGTINYRYAGRALLSSFNTHSKVKPKGEDGSKLLLVHSRTENPATFGTSASSFFGQTRTDVKITTTTGSARPISYNVGDVMAFVYQKSDRIFQKYAFLVYDAKTLTRKLTKEITLDKAARPIYARDMPNGDMAFIFLPLMKHEAIPKHKPHAQDKPIFKYLRINMKGETIADVDFELPKNKVGQPYTLSLIPHSDPANTTVYLMGYGSPDFLGMGTKEIGASFASAHGNRIPRMTNMTAKKLDKVVLGKMTTKMEYLNLMSPTEFWTKTKLPAGSKAKVPAGNEAAKFFLTGTYILEATSINGDDFIIGCAAADGQLFTIQCGESGNMKNVFFNYSGKVNFQEATLIPRPGGKIMALMTHQPASKDESEVKVNNYKRSIEAFIIDPAAGTVSANKSLLPKKTFVDLVDPIKRLSDTELLILGHTSTKDLSLAKVKF